MHRLLRVVWLSAVLTTLSTGVAHAVDYTSYSGFVVDGTPVLPASEQHPCLWFDAAGVEAVRARKDADAYAGMLYEAIAGSRFVSEPLPAAPGGCSEEAHVYYGTMARMAKYSAFMFVMTGDQAQRQRAVEALLRAYDGPIDSCDPKASSSPVDETYRGVWAQNFAAAYDWVQPTLTPEEDEAIRARLIKEAQTINDNLFHWTPRPHNHLSKPAWGLGTLALVLSSHPNASTWLANALEASNRNTSYFFSSDGIYREGSQYYIYSALNFLPFLHHYKNAAGVDLFPSWRPAFIWEFHVSNNVGWMPNLEDSYLRHNFLGMVAGQYMTDADTTPLHPQARWGNLFQWRYQNTDTAPWGGELGNNTGASKDDTIPLDKYLTYDPTVTPVAPSGGATQFLDEGGQTIFRNNWDYNSADSRYLLFHAVAEADNHNHFDTLSFLIHAEDQMMASAPGYSTSGYGDAERRSWYRTAQASNTVTCDGSWPTDLAENATPPSSGNVDTPFFDFQEKRARFIPQQNDDSKGENPLRYPPEEENLGTVRRSVAFPGQDYFVVSDRLVSRDGNPRHWEVYLHGGRGEMTSSGNHRMWTYAQDDFGGEARLAAWVFSSGGTLQDAEGALTYIRNDAASFDYVTAGVDGAQAGVMQVLIPLSMGDAVPVVTELSDTTRVGGTVQKEGHVDTFVTQPGNVDVTLGDLRTDAGFAWSREGNGALQVAAHDVTKLAHRGVTLARSHQPITLALDLSDTLAHHGWVALQRGGLTLELRAPPGAHSVEVMLNGVKVAAELVDGFTRVTLDGGGTLSLRYVTR
ncbi:MAG: heparinase II/III family protein [Myxococcota bacterium]